MIVSIEVCELSVCKEYECRKRHPKSCKNGTHCRFHKKNKCAFKHQVAKPKENTAIIEQMKSYEKDVKNLKAEIEYLKNSIQETENELKDAKYIYETKGKHIDILERENHDLRTENETLRKQVSDLMFL